MQVGKEARQMNNAELLQKIDAAALAVNKTEKAVEAAQAARVEKCKSLGTLLLEAKKRHPAVKDFEAFLKQAKHMQLRTAYDYMRLVGGRKTDDEIRKAEQQHREAARDRKRKSRTLPKPTPEPVCVTKPDVTQSVPIAATAEQSAELRKAENAARVATLADAASHASELNRCIGIITEVSVWIDVAKPSSVVLRHIREVASNLAKKADALTDKLRQKLKIEAA
jgi:hypothetical protein